MYNLNEKKTVAFEEAMIEFFQSEKTFASPLEQLTEAFAYLTGIAVTNLKDNKVSCNIIATAILLGFARISNTQCQRDGSDDLSERVLDLLREITRTFAYKGQRFEVDIMSKKK